MRTGGVGQVGGKGRGDDVSLTHHHRLPLECSEDYNRFADAGDLRRADEDRFELLPAAERRVNHANEAVTVPAVSVALHVNVYQAERWLRRVADRARHQYSAGAGREDGLARSG